MNATEINTLEVAQSLINKAEEKGLFFCTHPGAGYVYLLDEDQGFHFSFPLSIEQMEQAILDGEVDLNYNYFDSYVS